jgi:hypothetical protein
MRFKTSFSRRDCAWRACESWFDYVSPGSTHVVFAYWSNFLNHHWALLRKDSRFAGFRNQIAGESDLASNHWWIINRTTDDNQPQFGRLPGLVTNIFCKKVPAKVPARTLLTG